MNYIGLDPGDRWVGVAILYRNMTLETGKKPSSVSMKKQWKFHSLTVDRKGQRLVETIDNIRELIQNFGVQTLIAEDYQIRPQGFNSFNAGPTLRLLGALELMTQTFNQMPFHMVKPDNPDLAQLFWRHRWPEIRKMIQHKVARDSRATHAISAWRVLGKFLMSNDLLTLQQVHNE